MKDCAATQQRDRAAAQCPPGRVYLSTFRNVERLSPVAFHEGGITAGMVYYASFKLTDDLIEGLPGIFVPGKNKVFAIGPEVTIALASKTKVYGFLKVNYEWEVYARTTTQGSEFSIMATFPFPPFPVPTK